jgi:predicted transcriptional regulator of viral defense system
VNAIEAFARLQRLGVAVVDTADVAALLAQSCAAANQTLSRLAEAQLITRIRHGTWWIRGDVDSLRLPEYLTAPYPSYVSLHTALHVHGMIEQIPEVVYAVSLGRTEVIATKASSFSMHHVAPEVFCGFEESAQGTKLATPEKALFDVAYLSGGRSRRFTSLPELVLPRKFRKSLLVQWLDKIPSKRSRTLTESKLQEFLAQAAPS